MIDLYGIPNCDTVRKARAWLDQRGVAYTFHDFKKEGVDADRLARWSAVLGWEALLNRRGTTFRGLAETDKMALDRDNALRLMQTHPSLIRRPVVERDADVFVGFDPGTWSETLG